MEQTVMVEAPKRPVFLTILCILTFIGSGLSVFSSINSYLTADASAKVMEAMEGVSQETGGFMSKLFSAMAGLADPALIKKLALVGLICSLLTLTGAIMMWMLRKTGFYVYVAGIVVSIIVPLVLIGGMMGVMSVMGSLIFGGLFIVLYGLNLKHMTK